MWTNKELDIAIIKIASENLLSLSLGNSDKVSIGEEIYMVSNPTGYSFKEELSVGVISSTKNTIKTIENENVYYAEDIMQVNFGIEVSKSGSPILNKNGEVLGIVSSKLNCVIPINRIKNILNRFKEDGEFNEAYLGLYGFDNDALQYLNLDYISSIGIYVENIVNDSPVYGEIQEGDIITKIDDFELSSMQELSNYIYTKNPGDGVKLYIIRGTKPIEIECKLSKKK